MQAGCDRGGGLDKHGAEAFGASKLAAQACLGVYGAEGHDAGVLAALVCLGNMEPRSTTQAG